MSPKTFIEIIFLPILSFVLLLKFKTNPNCNNFPDNSFSASFGSKYDPLRKELIKLFTLNNWSLFLNALNNPSSFSADLGGVSLNPLKTDPPNFGHFHLYFYELF